MASAGGLKAVKYRLAPQTNMTITRMNGMTIHTSSSGMLPRIGRGLLVFRAAAVFDGEVENQQENQPGEKPLTLRK